MKRIFLLLIICLGVSLITWAQPTYTTNPAVFTAEDEITLTVNVTGTSLGGYSGDVWIWAWIAQGCSSNCDAPSNVNPASAAAANPALMTRDPNNANVYSITFVPTAFFNKTPAEIQKFGFKLKSVDWSDGKQSDNDRVLNVEPLVFTPKLARTFPSRASKKDVITLYLDQTLATQPALKYELSDFMVEVTAYDEIGSVVAGPVTKNAVNQGSGVHYTRILPTYTFGISTMHSVKYRFISKNNTEVSSEWFEVLLLDLK